MGFSPFKIKADLVYKSWIKKYLIDDRKITEITNIPKEEKNTKAIEIKYNDNSEENN